MIENFSKSAQEANNKQLSLESRIERFPHDFWYFSLLSEIRTIIFVSSSRREVYLVYPKSRDESNIFPVCPVA